MIAAITWWEWPILVWAAVWALSIFLTVAIHFERLLVVRAKLMLQRPAISDQVVVSDPK